MIKEALKTAEIHDSYEKLKKEAEHVAKLIKKSEYCIAFTGMHLQTSFNPHWNPIKLLSFIIIFLYIYIFKS